MKMITISTVKGDTFTVTDSSECKMASMSLAQFRRGGIMSFLVDGKEMLVPPTAVDNIRVEEVVTEEEITPTEG